MQFVFESMFDKAEDLLIEFVKLKDGKHLLKFRVDESFFVELGSMDVLKADVFVSVNIEKNVNLMQLHLGLNGFMTVECHRCLVDLPLEIDSKYRLFVNLDSHENLDIEYSDDGSELVYLKSHEFELSIAKSVFESCFLALPILRNCDESDEKPCNQIMIQKLQSLIVESTNEVDSRWDKLKQIKNK